MRNEDGISAGARNFGRFWLAAIPWILGLGASAWLGFYISLHYFRKELSQEERAAIYVGATERPKDKIQIDIKAVSCLVITRADVDGDSLTLYARNDCHRTISYAEWHWQLISPDGTALKSGWTNGAGCPTDLSPNDKAECPMKIEADDRAARLRVWTTQ